MKKAIFITLGVLLIDQLSKIYIKTHFEIGESFKIFSWFKIYFLENPGMAYGINLGGGYVGKYILSFLRLILIVFIFFWIRKNILKGASNYFIIPTSLIFAGAIGNLIDSAFYGIIFNSGTTFSKIYNNWVSYPGISKLSTSGYANFMSGCVVDMLYFPLFNIHFPKWIPFIGGKEWEFFQPVFNMADTAISIGVGLLLLFNKKNHKIL